MSLFESLNVGSKEFDEISSIVQKTCPNQCIISIEKLINITLIERYEKYKDSLQEQKYTELFGFHGTNINNIDIIASEGFKKEFNKTSAYGLGTYLASSFGYSKNYAKLSKEFKDSYKCLFVCKFIYVNIIKGCGSKKCPEHFDVQVDKIENPNIYCVDKDEAIIPLYLVRFYDEK
jgi:hypothetical protein